MSTRQTETSMSALHDAARSNNINEVQHLLTTDGVDVNARDSHGNTALHLTKDKSIASLLINACADPNLQNADGDTPLQMWHTLNLVTGDTGRPFTGFLLDNDRKYLLDIITLLLEAGASPNIQNKHGYNSLHSLFVYGGIAGLELEAHLMHDFISLLVRFGVDVNAPDFERSTPLHHAAKEPHVLNAETLIRSGALVDARDYRGLTPLQHVFNSDNKEMLQLLMQNKASVNAQDVDGRTALSTAVESGNEVMVELLLEHPCTCVDLADKNCVTPLHLAAAFKHVDMTERLIRASADANARDVMNATPLHYAAYGGTPEIITLLLEAGADDKLTDNSGRLPVQYALSRHYCHTALKFGERYLHDVAESARCHVKVTGNTTDDVIVHSLPADDIFTMVVPASKVYSDALDLSIVPRDLMEYMRDKSAGNVSGYLKDMYTVPGVGQVPADMGEVENTKIPADMGEIENMKIPADMGEVENLRLPTDTAEVENMNIPTDMGEVKNMKRSIEEFMSKWAEKIAEIDERFKGALLHSGSVYEGTKVGDPDEFDYMLCLESLAQACSITFDEDTEYSKVTVHKSVDESGSYEEFFDGHQLDSGKVMSAFVDVAKRALTLLDYTSVAREMYVESLTEHTLIEDTWTLSGTVTCNLKFKWTGLCYKQLVITVDLVPAIPVHHWPRIARQVSSVLTEDITSRGCHLVAKAGYWRLSFSLAERLIMSSLSWEQKSAFIGAKVVLHPAVSCKIIVYDDEHISDDEESANRSCGLEDHSDGQAAGTSHREGT